MAFSVSMVSDLGRAPTFKGGVPLYPFFQVVTQAKSLCGQHIRAWLKRRGLFTRKLGLQRLRSVASLPGGLAVCDVFVQLEALSLELERKHGKLYTGVCRQVGSPQSRTEEVRVNYKQTQKAVCRTGLNSPGLLTVYILST